MGVRQTLTLVAAVLVCYYNSLNCGFVFDDVSAIKDNKDLRPNTPIKNIFLNDFWGTPMTHEKSHKSYRPLCVLTFRLNYLIGEKDPFGYHLVNVLLHVVVTLLFHRLCRDFMSCQASFLASMIFAVHPVHTEAVTGVVGRAELLSAFFFLCGLSSYRRCNQSHGATDWRRVVLTAICVATAVLCKEQGITLVGVCVVYEYISNKLTAPIVFNTLQSMMKHRTAPVWLTAIIKRVCVLIGMTSFLLFARLKVMGAQLPVFTKFDNPAAVSDTPTRQMTFNFLLPMNAWLTLCPSFLCCDWTMGSIPLVESILDSRNLATIAFYLMLWKLVSVGLWQSGPAANTVVMALALTCLPFLPASNLFFPVGFVVAERVLYLPSMGVCLLVGQGFEKILQKKRRLNKFIWCLMILQLVTFSVKTVSRNKDWKSEYTLFMSALKVNTNNAKLYNNVGHALEGQGQLIKALDYFQQAARVQPDDIGAHMNVGRTLAALNKSVEAEKAYRVALDLFPPVIPGKSYTARVAPNHLNVFLNLANLISKDPSRLMEADSLYRTALSMRSDFTQAYINRGDIMMRLNKTREAFEQYQLALKYDPANPDIFYNLGVVSLEIQDLHAALTYFDQALDLDPDHRQSLFNSAVLIQELGHASLQRTAVSRLNHLLNFERDNEKIYFNLGMLFTDMKDIVQAEKALRHAVQLRPDFRSALFNLALMLVNDFKQPSKAVPVVQQLLQHHPHHVKGLILMGDLNINLLKDLDAAERNFLTILELEPQNVQAAHNLCVVYVERGSLSQAEECLVRVLEMAPNEDYIRRHLGIVRGKIAEKKSRTKKQTDNN